MRDKRTLWYAGLPALVLVISIGAAAALQNSKAPPPMGHPHMMVPPGARRIHSELERVSQSAAKKGMYTCCINPPCEFCAVHMAMCPCGKELVTGKPVCRECKGGWDVGEGRIAGVNPAEVKGTSTKQEMDMMHGMQGGMGGMHHGGAHRGGKHH